MERAHQGWILGLSSLGPRTCLPWVLSLPWSCVEAYQGRALDFVNPYGSASAKVGFDESCVQCKYCALTYTPLTKWQVLETRWCLSVGLTKGGPWVSRDLWRIDQGIFRLGFWAPYSCIHCIHITRHGWYALKTWWYVSAYMSLAVSGTHWRLGRVLVGICHSPWVTCTGVTVMRSYMYVTRCGWHILESRWKYALECMPLIMGDTHWILSSMLLHICLLRSGAYWRLNNVLLRACHSS